MLKNDLVRLRHIPDAAREAVNYSQNRMRKKGFFDSCGLRGIGHCLCVGKGGIH